MKLKCFIETTSSKGTNRYVCNLTEKGAIKYYCDGKVRSISSLGITLAGKCDKL